jgi:[ribosomal protein S18]-alanine N-acetyltransferase
VSAPGIRFSRLDEVSSADRTAILELEAESFANPWTAESFDAMRSSPASRIYVARQGSGRLLAFCALWHIVDELHIHTITVDAKHRRRGIALGLLRHILRETRAVRATLEVRRSNVAAIKLYERLGFKVTAVRERYYENPQEDGLILWLIHEIDFRNPTG